MANEKYFKPILLLRPMPMWKGVYIFMSLKKEEKRFIRVCIWIYNDINHKLGGIIGIDRDTADVDRKTTDSMCTSFNINNSKSWVYISIIHNKQFIQLQ